MRKALVKPAPGLKVRDPQTFVHLRTEGEEVLLDGEHGTYWRKRLAAGDVVRVEAKQTRASKPSRNATPSKEDS